MTPGISDARRRATAQVPSVLALSAMVMRKVKADWRSRYSCRRSTFGRRSASSSYTGRTTSTKGGAGAEGRTICGLDGRSGAGVEAPPP